MAGASLKKLVDFIWGEPDDSQENYDEGMYNQEYEEEYEQEEPETESVGLFKRRNKVVPIQQPQQIKMKIAKPTNFDQARESIAQLKEKNSIVLNLEYVNKDVARRIVDVISGAVHALDGHIQKISNSIFLIAPFNYDITNEMAREEIKNKLSVSWIKNNSQM